MVPPLSQRIKENVYDQKKKKKERKKEKKGSEKIFEEIIVENCPNMGKEVVKELQEAHRIPYRINPRRNMPKHILIKLSKIK